MAIFLSNRLHFIRSKRLFLLLPLFVALFFIFKPIDAQAAGPTYIWQNINATTTWTRANSPYIIHNNYTININAPLTIEAGVVVKLEPYYWMNRFSGITANGPAGKIIAQGTNEEPIIFTSIFDHEYAPEIGASGNPIKGDWGNLKFNNDDSVLDHVIIRYGGSIYFANNSLGFNNFSRAQITNSIIESSASLGIAVTNNAAPLLDSLIIKNNNIAFSAGNDAGAGILKNSLIEDNLSAILFEIDADSLFRFENNTINNPGARYIKWTGSASREVVWHNLGLPYMNMPNVDASGTVNIKPGTIFKFQTSTYNTIRGLIKGVIHASGNQDNPIIFTSIKDDSVGGDTNADGNATSPAPRDWGELAFENTPATSTLDFAEVRFGGEYNGDFSGIMFVTNHYDSIYLKNAKLAISNSKITNGSSAGILAMTSASLSLANSEISNHQTGITINTTAGVNIHNNKIFNNTQYGLNNQSSSVIDATNNWWGSDSGPTNASNPTGTGDRITGNVLFDPWVGKIKKKTPVIIVPGIMGSYLNKDDGSNEEIWPSVNKIIWSYSDNFLNYLTMDNYGLSDNGIKTDDIIRKIQVLNLTDKDFFDGLIKELTQNGYQEGKDLFVFPYDWRQNIEYSASDLNKKINNILASTSAEKVDIIAHSMGGLVVKYYIRYFNPTYQNNLIDKFIDIGTPHYGAPKAFKILMFGDDLDFNLNGLSLLNQDEIKNISQNMPAVYQLLPSRQYFNPVITDYDYYINNFDNKLDYNQSINFLKDNNKNSLLISEADDFHSYTDYFTSDLYNISTYNIVGCNLPTLGSIKIDKGWLGNKYKLDYFSGDGTVPLQSAEGIDGKEKYYVEGVAHSDLPSADGIKQLIVNILDYKQSTFNYSEHPNISQHSYFCNLNGLQIGIHSPLTLHIYDENNNHNGPNENGGIDKQIPGSQYDIIDDNKFVFLPLGHQYRMTGGATDIGSFDSEVQTIENGQTVKTAYFNDVPINTLKTNIEMDVQDNQLNYNMKIDQDGDYVFESETQPSAILNQQESADETKPQTTMNVSGIEGNNNWHTSDVGINLTAEDNDDGSGILKTEYSLDDGQTWHTYNEIIDINNDGEYNLMYRSVDRAGNEEDGQGKIIKIDKTKPALTNTAINLQHTINSSSTLFYFSGQDNGSGLMAISATLDKNILNSGDPINFNDPGSHQIIITAEDNAGNIIIKTIDFKIIYNFNGFLSPINADGTGLYKLGRTIPIKFSLTDANGKYVPDVSAKLSAAFIQNNIIGVDTTTVSTANADTGNIFRYDLAQNQYIYNLSTNTFLAGAWRLKVSLDDGQIYTVLVSFKN